MGILDDIANAQQKLLKSSRQPYPTGAAALPGISPVAAAEWEQLLAPHRAAAAVHTVPPPALHPANVRAAVDNALGRTRPGKMMSLPVVTDPTMPRGAAVLSVRDDDLRHDPGPVQQHVQELVRAQRRHDIESLRGLLYARPHPDDGTGWRPMGTAVADEPAEPRRPEPPELWWSRTLAEDDEAEGGLIVCDGGEYRRERYARPWWPIDELPADAVRLAPEPGTVSR